tara:strand:- start:325 stop:435 length:111 start_codon:yes stop_codon:yes gene_type:complete
MEVMSSFRFKWEKMTEGGGARGGIDQSDARKKKSTV